MKQGCSDCLIAICSHSGACCEIRGLTVPSTMQIVIAAGKLVDGVPHYETRRAVTIPFAPKYLSSPDVSSNTTGDGNIN